MSKLLYTRGMNPMVRAETLLALGDSAAAVSIDAFVDFLGSQHLAAATFQALAVESIEGFVRHGARRILLARPSRGPRRRRRTYSSASVIAVGS